MEQLDIEYQEAKYRFYKWTKGDPYEKSERVNNNSDNKNFISNKTERNINAQKQHTPQKHKTDVNNLQQNIIDTERISILSNNTQYTRQSNKRTTHNDLLLQRDPIIQKNVNPFITRSNYIEDLNNEAKFLRPKDSNLEYER